MTRGFLGNINKTKYNGAAFRWTGVVCATERDGGEGEKVVEGSTKEMKETDRICMQDMHVRRDGVSEGETKTDLKTVWWKNT